MTQPSTRVDEGRRYPVYVKRPSWTWWLRTKGFRRFALREATAVFAGAFSVILLLFLYALSRGRDSYESFLRWLELPWVIILSAVILGAMVYHAGSWFRLTSHILVVRLGRRVLSRKVVTVGLVALWLGVSGVVLYFHVWF